MGDGGRRQAGQIGAEQGRARQQAGGGDQRMVGDQRAERPRPDGRFDQAADGGAGVFVLTTKACRQETSFR
jgi:hypothetical protein